MGDARPEGLATIGFLARLGVPPAGTSNVKKGRASSASWLWGLPFGPVGRRVLAKIRNGIDAGFCVLRTRVGRPDIEGGGFQMFRTQVEVRFEF